MCKPEIKKMKHDGYEKYLPKLFIHHNHISLDDVQVVYPDNEYDMRPSIKKMVGNGRFYDIIKMIDINPYQLTIMKNLYLDGYSQSCVAGLLGITQSSVCQTKNRIIKKLRNKFDV